MDYQKIYTSLVSKASNRKTNDYTERHHIIPLCLGGTNQSENLVNLTPEEHYLAHQLLIKIYPNHKGLVYAALKMGATRKGNKVYGWLRRSHSDFMKTRTGTKNSQFGTKWINDGVVSKKIKGDEDIPMGWVSGRVKKVKKVKKAKKYIKKGPYRPFNEKNPMWKGYVVTPLGIFSTMLEAAKIEGVNVSTISRRIKSDFYSDYYLKE